MKNEKKMHQKMEKKMERENYKGKSKKMTPCKYKQKGKSNG
jgi:hypothetical protein